MNMMKALVNSFLKLAHPSAMCCHGSHYNIKVSIKINHHLHFCVHVRYGALIIWSYCVQK